VERKLAALEEEVASCEAQMHAADPTDFATLGELAERQKAAKAQIPELEDEWVELTDRLS
jgi:hypothetical protein